MIEPINPALTGSDGQLVAALEATRLQDGTAGLGRHPNSEAVGLGSLAGVWLIGALHLILAFRSNDAAAPKTRDDSIRVRARRGSPC